jgi:hypothetical protein
MATLIDLNKKGTVIIGNMRSGTNLTVALINKQLTELEIPYQNNGEYFFDITQKPTMRHPKYAYFNMLNHLQKITVDNTKYSIGTIIYPKLMDMIAYNPETLSWCNQNLHLVKLLRKDHMAHFMSHCIFLFSKKQYGLESLSEVKMNIPFSPTLHEINYFIHSVLEVIRFPCDNVVEYESLPHDPVGEVKKNIYNLEPKDFFADYEHVSELLSTLKYNLA